MQGSLNIWPVEICGHLQVDAACMMMSSSPQSGAHLQCKDLFLARRPMACQHGEGCVQHQQHTKAGNLNAVHMHKGTFIFTGRMQ